MSDDLVKQLHKAFEWCGDPMLEQAADRIEELEAKLAQQDDLVQAAVAAALREAAQAARLSISERDEWPPKDGDVLVDDCMTAILALITDDAQAALDRVVAAALREAVAAVKKDADNDDISHGAAQWVSDTILALIPQSAKAESDA